MSTPELMDVVEQRFGQRYRSRVNHQMRFLYRNIDFSEKIVLDIGGGVGLHSYYAASHSARKVTIIEPEGDGGHDQMLATFQQLKGDLGNPNVELLQCRFQDYVDSGQTFDVVLIQDAINHFDEQACITLRCSSESVAVYDEIFTQIAALVAPGGQLIMSDCSSHNLFPTLGMKNPFDPNIEWHKHQPPWVWEDFCRRHGLEMTDRRWSTPTKLGSIGEFLANSAIGAWFFTSHFVQTFSKDQTA